jgi:fused signal recognition particle receptor
LQEEISGLLAETNTGEATEFVPKDKSHDNGSRCKWVGKTTTIGKLAFQFKSRL